jgi:hypothetical protein
MYKRVLWHVDLLLGNDREINKYTTAVTRQRHVNSNRGAVFSTWCCRDKLELTELVGE